MKDLWTDTPLSDLLPDLEIPRWIEEGLTDSDISAICQGGCASGAYMPAVTYHIARTVMAVHGDAVLQFIEDTCGELPKVPGGESWSGIAVFYLSVGVELWASGILSELEDLEDD